MLVGKDTENVVNNELFVDKWIIDYKKNKDTGKDDIEETYSGQVPIGKTTEHKYLGFVISSTGDNMANINQIKKKSIGVVRKIINRLNSLHLRDYFFECSIILMNSILRGSILYASETYYNLKEIEIRQIERIEEGYMRKVLKTTKGCPIVQIYLEMGQIPARFEVQKMRCLYLKYILHEEEESLLKKVFNLQLKDKSRGDWAMTVLEDLKELRITETFEEIKLLNVDKFRNILKVRIKENALRYLTGKQRSKGKEMVYTDIEMAEYLQPSSPLTISQKQTMFAVKNRMIEISENFPGKNIEDICHCGKKETMEHIYNCNYLNEGNLLNIKYENIFNGSLKDQIKILEKIQENLEKREKVKEIKKEKR
jgi:hypothetical protein